MRRGSEHTERTVRRRGRGVLVAFVAAGVALGVAAVATAAGVHHGSSNHFEVAFPEGWVRVADGVAKDYADSVSRLMGTRPSYEAFYERADATEHFAYPYVMVDFHAGDTRMYREFSKHMEKGFQSAADTVASRADGFLSGIEFGKPVLEAPLSRFWVKMKMDVAGVSVTGLSLMKMGAKGIAVVNFYSRTDEFESHEAEFRSIADSCRFASGWRHDPVAGPPFFSTRLGRLALFAGIGGLLGAVLALVRWRRGVLARVRLAETYAPPPPGAPLSRTLLDPDSIGREESSPGSNPHPAPRPSPRAVPASASRAPLPSEEEPLHDPSARKFPAASGADRWRPPS
jgi:hypothetical protein